NELQAIFGPAIVNVSVSIADNFSIDGVGIIPEQVSGVWAYQQPLRRIINQYENALLGGYDEDTYFIFLLGEYDGDRSGFMPRKKRHGFLFLNNVGNTPEAMARATGHELGHGAYHLQHTWEEVPGLGQGDTDNLMDY
ncbi:MAG: hypothetical protein AAFU03_16330, partial [Bacteroidota bacterium]